MKGVNKYIKKYGRHFTEKLATDAVKCRWNIGEINKTLNKKVWYNVSEATTGDILFLTNLAGSFGKCFSIDSKSKCVDFALAIVGNVEHNGIAFETWLSIMKKVGKDFDFSGYIE